MFVSGSVFDDSKGDEVCYVPIFGHGGIYPDDHWVIGSHFMKENYFIFDQTPKYEKNKNYI